MPLSNIEEYGEDVEILINCYKQMYPETTIFMADKVEDVHWGNWSLVQADLACMKQLLELDSQ